MADRAAKKEMHKGLHLNTEDRDGTETNNNNRWVVNLSGQPLDEAEIKVLTHGPNFAITSRAPPW